MAKTFFEFLTISLSRLAIRFQSNLPEVITTDSLKSISSKNVKALTGIISNKNNKIERMETENQEKKTAIKELKDEVNRLKVEEEGAQWTEKLLKRKWKSNCADRRNWRGGW